MPNTVASPYLGAYNFCREGRPFTLLQAGLGKFLNKIGTQVQTCRIYN